MEIITVTLILLFGVVASAFLGPFLPVPRPLLQITLGMIFGLFNDYSITLNPHIFMFLFLPPLLFLDGWRIPKENFRKDIKPILGLALGLVIFTVLGMGLFIHWLIPAMPLPVAFALAAIVSPTDPIAVSSMAQRVPIPKRLMHLLEGEALLNDASGLVCFRFAVAAMLTGTFSLAEAMGEFVWLAIGGIAIGVLVTRSILWAKVLFFRHYKEESSVQILISLLIPFAAYILAENIDCSGILAVVSAGISMSFAELSGNAMADTRMKRNNVWDVIQFTANGMIFVMLGEQLPDILFRAADTVQESGHVEAWWLIIYVLAISAGLAALRFSWVYVSFLLASRAKAKHNLPTLPLNWRLITAMSFAGVRGAITLAGILTLPLIMNDGSPFPARDLAIFLAMGVIITSMLAASFGLPILLKGITLPPESGHEREENQARIIAAQAALDAVEEAQTRLSADRADADIYVSAASTVMNMYRARLENAKADDDLQMLARERQEREQEFHLIAIAAERTAIFKLARNHTISSETAIKLVRHLDLQEARHAV